MFGAAYKLLMQMYIIEKKVWSKSVNPFSREKGTKTRPQGITTESEKRLLWWIKSENVQTVLKLYNVHIVGLQTKGKL